MSSLIARAEWMACKGDVAFVDGEEVFLALDLSSVHDLTALVMVSASDRSRILPFFWKPADYLAEHAKRDFGAGSGRYQQWVDEGHLLSTPGRTVDKAFVAAKIAELCARYAVLGMAYDRWHIENVMKEFEHLEFETHKDGDKGGAGLRIVPWGQGFKDSSPAIDALETAVIERMLVHPGNPCLSWNIANAVAVTDPSGNRKIDKSKARFRIDGAVALAMALGLKARDAAKVGPSFEEELASIAW